MVDNGVLWRATALSRITSAARHAAIFSYIDTGAERTSRAAYARVAWPSQHAYNTKAWMSRIPPFSIAKYGLPLQYDAQYSRLMDVLLLVAPVIV